MPASSEIIGRRSTRSGRVREYIVRGADAEADAENQIVADAPASLDGFALTGVECTESGVEGLWRAIVQYGTGDLPEPQKGTPATDTTEFHFEIGVQPVRVFLPPKGGTITGYGPEGEPAPPQLQIIGDTGDPDQPASGAEIYEPYLEFSKTKMVPLGIVTTEYIELLGQLVGTLNDDEFEGFAAEEVLSKGVSGSRRGTIADWEINYRFAVRKHQTGLEIGDDHYGVISYDKKGWQHAWQRAYPVKVTQGSVDNVLVHKVQAIYCADLYPKSDFGGFAL